MNSSALVRATQDSTSTGAGANGPGLRHASKSDGAALQFAAIPAAFIDRARSAMSARKKAANSSGDSFIGS